MRTLKLQKIRGETFVIDTEANEPLSCPLKPQTPGEKECSDRCVGFHLRDAGVTKKAAVVCQVFDMVICELPTENETDAAEN